jgi:hypothetical protein
MADNDDPLAKFRGVMPSRAELCQLVLFGTTDKIRAAAQTVLDLLPPMTTKEKENWSSAVWAAAKLPSEADLAKSPIGRQTLAMLRANAPMSAQKSEAVVPVEAEGPESKPPEPAIPPESAIEPVNPYLQKISWPPKGTITPQPKPDEQPRDNLWPRFVAGRPSEPDKSQRPISDWESDDRQPIY